MVNFVDANCEYLKLKSIFDDEDCIDIDPDYIAYFSKFEHKHNDVLGYGKFVIKYDDYNNFIERMNSKPQNSKNYVETDSCYTFYCKFTIVYIYAIKLLKCKILPEINQISLDYLNGNYKKIKNIINRYKKYIDADFESNVDPIVAYNIATVYQLESKKKYEKDMIYYYTIAINSNINVSFYNLYLYYKDSNHVIAKKYRELGIKYDNIDCQILLMAKFYINSSQLKKKKCLNTLLDAYNKDKTNIDIINNLAYVYYYFGNSGKMLYFINKSVEYNCITAYSMISLIEDCRNHLQKSLLIKKNALDVSKSPIYRKYIISVIAAYIILYPVCKIIRFFQN